MATILIVSIIVAFCVAVYVVHAYWEYVSTTFGYEWLSARFVLAIAALVFSFGASSVKSADNHAAMVGFALFCFFWLLFQNIRLVGLGHGVLVTAVMILVAVLVIVVLCLAASAKQDKGRKKRRN